jgi:hypothetical protein
MELTLGPDKLTTFWLVPKSGTNSSSCTYSSAASSEGDAGDQLGDDANRDLKVATKARTLQIEKKQRLVKWNTEMLLTIVKTIVAHRIDSGIQPDASSMIIDLERGILGPHMQVIDTVADEVVEVIRLPKLEASANRKIPPTLTRLTYRRRPSRSWKTTSRL